MSNNVKALVAAAVHARRGNVQQASRLLMTVSQSPELATLVRRVNAAKWPFGAAVRADTLDDFDDMGLGEDEVAAESLDFEIPIVAESIDFEIPIVADGDDGFDEEVEGGAFDDVPMLDEEGGAFDDVPEFDEEGGAFDDVPEFDEEGGAFDDVPMLDDDGDEVAADTMEFEIPIVADGEGEDDDSGEGEAEVARMSRALANLRVLAARKKAAKKPTKRK